MLKKLYIIIAIMVLSQPVASQIRYVTVKGSSGLSVRVPWEFSSLKEARVNVGAVDLDLYTLSCDCEVNINVADVTPNADISVFKRQGGHYIVTDGSIRGDIRTIWVDKKMIHFTHPLDVTIEASGMNVSTNELDLDGVVVPSYFDISCRQSVKNAVFSSITTNMVSPRTMTKATRLEPIDLNTDSYSVRYRKNNYAVVINNPSRSTLSRKLKLSCDVPIVAIVERKGAMFYRISFSTTSQQRSVSTIILTINRRQVAYDFIPNDIKGEMIVKEFMLL